MNIEVVSLKAQPAQCVADLLILGVFERGALPAATAEVDLASGGAIRARIEAGDVGGKPKQVSKLFDLPNVAAKRVLLVGLGDAAQLNAARYLDVVREALKALRSGPTRKAASWLAELPVQGRDAAWAVREHVIAAEAALYRYDATRRKPEKPEGLAELAIATHDETSVQSGRAIAHGVRRTRELGNLPPNICTPLHLADVARQMARDFANVEVDVLDRAQMQALGMNALIGVARGSAHPPQLIVLRYRGTRERKPVALVGKGVTFDTGGISIKPAAGMDEMKYDMCGAASVFGAIEASARLGLPVDLIGIVPAVENMPDGDASRPGDVVTTLSGLTVEVLNTDAEGRLILCDALTYARRFEPETVIDIATLTGACIVALGKHASGLMTKHDDLAEELLAAGVEVHDRAWRLPLWDDYQGQLESGFADLANIGGKNAGAITAGCFLARFTEGLRWAHLDVAGSASDEGRKGGATGRPVPLLMQWLMQRVA
jgi:leucyl aminopeptidase